MADYLTGGYLLGCFKVECLRLYIDNCAKALLPHVKKFDCIVFRGVSGAMVAPAVAAILQKPLCCVRKSDGNHSGKPVEGFYEKNMKYVIIDDFVCTGSTIKKIIEEMKDFEKTATCYAGCFYLSLASEDRRERTFNGLFMENRQGTPLYIAATELGY